MGRSLSSLLFLLLGLLTTRIASAAVEVCLEVEGPKSVGDLEKLVRSEVARHPTHRLVEGDCTSHLRVELLEVDKERYLTAQVDGEVPYREAVGSDLSRSVEHALSVVLHNDPRVLSEPSRTSWTAQKVSDFRLRSQTYFGAELGEVIGLLHGEPQTLAQVSAVMRREVDNWHLAARLGFASSLGEHSAKLNLSEQVVAQLELAVFANGSAAHSAYGAVVAGLEAQRFEGPVPASPEDRGTFTKLGFSAGLRGGYEVLRVSDVHASLFAQVLLPTFVAKDIDGGLVNAWVPSASVGIAAMF